MNRIFKTRIVNETRSFAVNDVVIVCGQGIWWYNENKQVSSLDAQVGVLSQTCTAFEMKVNIHPLTEQDRKYKVEWRKKECLLCTCWGIAFARWSYMEGSPRHDG